MRDAERDGRDASVTETVHVSRGDVTSFDCDDHDVLLGFDDGKTAAVVTALTDRGLIIGGRLASWDERQPLLRDSAGRRQSSSAARSAAYRARKKAAQQSSQKERDAGVTQHVAGVTGDESHAEVTPDKTRADKSNNPPSPPAGGGEPANSKSQRAKSKRPLPLPFHMTNEMLAWAAEKAPAVNLDRETESFIDYFTGEGKAKADWQATWRNWMRRAQGDIERRGGGRPSGKPPGGPGDTSWIDEDDGV